VAAAMKKKDKPLSALAKLMKVFPQVLISINVKSRPEIDTVPEIMAVIREVETILGTRAGSWSVIREHRTCAGSWWKVHRRKRRPGIAEGVNIKWIVADLDDYVIREQYDLIVICFFHVSKNMVLSITNALKKGGILLYENHWLPPLSAENDAHKHRFHLKPGELRHLFKGLNILRYEELHVDSHGDRPSYLARRRAKGMTAMALPSDR
jgi:hypothetical protein